jgi:fructokinase
MNPSNVCIFGEVLFDHFPDGSRVLGGAPFNVAWHLQAFGLAPRFISRVGADAEGDSVLQAMREWGMDTADVQVDPQRPTGRVGIAMVDNEPVYDIVADSAYDAIALPAEDLAPGALLYHGSLALRSALSRATFDALARMALASGTLFLDVNLRSPWWDRDSVMHRVRTAHWVKLNQDELERLDPAPPGGVTQAAAFLTGNHLKGLILTLGAEGARAITEDGRSFMVRPGHSTTVVDTVGAGDAFTAVTLLGIRSGWPLPLTLERAQTFASQVVGRHGATVQDRSFYEPLLSEWNLTAKGSG